METDNYPENSKPRILRIIMLWNAGSMYDMLSQSHSAEIRTTQLQPYSNLMW